MPNVFLDDFLSGHRLCSHLWWVNVNDFWLVNVKRLSSLNQLVRFFLVVVLIFGILFAFASAVFRWGRSARFRCAWVFYRGSVDRSPVSSYCELVLMRSQQSILRLLCIASSGRLLEIGLAQMTDYDLLYERQAYDETGEEEKVHKGGDENGDN
ncbi:hypothetical protein EDB84DRAFT_1440986 [Lactarius hengduanensis]|nr:hypothetical protein EDB84DRAFT_1440986 [Lactarius hengduanensis]